MKLLEERLSFLRGYDCIKMVQILCPFLEYPLLEVSLSRTLRCETYGSLYEAMYERL